MPRFILIPNLKPLPFPTIFLNLLIVVSLARAVFFINRECKKNEEERLRQNIIADRPLKTHIQLFPVNNQRNT
jgi:hypothetical protein